MENFKNYSRNELVELITTLHQQQDEQLKAKEIAEENEFFLSESQRVANIGSYKLDFNAGIWRSSKAIDTIFGIDETYDKTINGWLNLIHPEEKDKMTKYFSEEVIAKKQAFNYEYKIVRISDKQERWVHGLGALNFDSKGNLSYMVGTIQDVTILHQQQDEILKAKEIAEENENLYRKMNENSPLGMLFYKFENEQLIFTGANPAANKILNVDNQQFIGKTIEEAFPPLAQTEIPLRYCDAATKGIYWTTEEIIYDDNRIAGAYEVRAFQTSPNNMVAIFDDITPRKQAEHELVKLNNELELRVQQKTKDLEDTNDKLFTKNKIINTQNEELKATLQNLQETQSQLIQSEKMASLGILTAGVAHEINNPLNYIMGAYTGLQYHFENKSFCENYDQIEKLIMALKTGVDRSSAIVRGLNQFSRDSKLHNENCDIHAIIDNCLTMLQNQIKNKVAITKQYSPSDITIKGNVGNLHQVFINIIGNAIQSITKEGTIHICTKITNNNVHIEITDNGEGISPENIKRITDPFFTTRDPGKGTGLGLAITYNIIREHKGKIEFQSELGTGTTVKITLPQN